MQSLTGVLRVEATPLTRNVLVLYAPSEADERTLLAALGAIDPEPAADGRRSSRRSVEPARGPSSRRAERRLRLAVPGLGQSPRAAARAIEALERREDVSRAVADPVTGQLLIEVLQGRADRQALLAEVARALVDEPPSPPIRLLYWGRRLAGGALRVGLRALRSVVRSEAESMGRRAAVRVAIALASLERLSPLTRLVEAVLDRGRRRDLVLEAISLAAVTSPGGWIGVAVAVAIGLRPLLDSHGRAAPLAVHPRMRASELGRSVLREMVRTALADQWRAMGHSRFRSTAAARLAFAVRILRAVAPYHRSLAAVTPLVVVCGAVLDLLDDPELAGRPA